MYEDIYSLTDKMFSVAKKNKQKSKMRSVYDVYRNIQNYNDALRRTLVGYFDKSLDEDFLTQTTSFGSWLEKWVYFTNEDFGKLTKTTKKLLRSLIPIEELPFGRLKNIYGKVYSGIVDDYVSGVVRGDGMFLTQSVISLSKKTNFSSKELELDISSFDKRAALIEKTNETPKEMENLQREFRAYILSNSAVEDLL